MNENIRPGEKQPNNIICFALIHKEQMYMQIHKINSSDFYFILLIYHQVCTFHQKLAMYVCIPMLLSCFQLVNALGALNLYLQTG